MNANEMHCNKNIFFHFQFFNTYLIYCVNIYVMILIRCPFYMIWSVYCVSWFVYSVLIKFFHMGAAFEIYLYM